MARSNTYARARASSPLAVALQASTRVRFSFQVPDWTRVAYIRPHRCNNLTALDHFIGRARIWEPGGPGIDRTQERWITRRTHGTRTVNVRRQADGGGLQQQEPRRARTGPGPRSSAAAKGDNRRDGGRGAGGRGRGAGVDGFVRLLLWCRNPMMLRCIRCIGCDGMGFRSTDRLAWLMNGPIPTPR